MSKIKARAVRDFTLGDDQHAAGAELDLPKNQFDDLESVGLVERASAAAASKPTETNKAG
jgi:hypothetical protein